MSLVIESPAPASLPDKQSKGNWRSSLGRLLGRTTSSGRFIPAIDGLRSLAIMAVIMHHLGGYVAQKTPGLNFEDARQTAVYRLINVGNCGVQLFFVISGFILALPFAEQRLRDGKPVRLKTYLWRRITRLHPPYLLNLAVMTVLLILIKHESWADLSPHLLASSFYLHNFVYHSMSSVNFVAWSLEIEVQFYLLAPLLTLVYVIPQTIVRRSLIAAAAASIMLLKWYGLMDGSYPLSGSLLYYLDYFLCGLLLADCQTLSRTPSLSSGAVGLAWDLSGLTAATGCLALVLNHGTWHLLPLALLPACLSVLRGPRLNRLFSLPLLVGIGGMCYTTYLYHFAVISLVGRFVAPWTTGGSYPMALALQSACTIPAILCFSAVLFVLVEKPCMTWGRSLRPASVRNS
ncbi:MAG: acyltransferase [Planctomycetes bacterium]|nr:acyltransferase [Planctomycetota bacterium]